MEDLKEEKLKLPRNIRQIGDKEDVVKIYIEDYASIYLKKLRPSGGQGLKIGLLLGNSRIEDGIPYIFIEGAMEIEGLNATPEQIEFTNEIWTSTYDNIKKYFEGQDIQGWFICGSLDVKLDSMDVWGLHTRYFPGKNQVLYISPTYELDEALYVTSVNGFYKTAGHCIYYERNEPMQDYMILRKEARRIEPDVDDHVIQSFRTVMEEKKEEAKKSRTVQMLYSACTFLTLVICAIGVTLINTHDKMKSMEVALTQISQGGTVMVNETPVSNEEDPPVSQETGGVVVNEIPGNVFPTTEAATSEPVTEPTSETEQEHMTAEETLPEETEAEAAATEAETKAETEVTTEAAAPVKTHIVASGDTLYSICIKYYGNLSMVDKLCEANGLDNQDIIIEGQELVLP